MPKSGTIRFEIRKEKVDKSDKSIIRLIYQVRGNRRYISTKEKILSVNWDAKRQIPHFIDKKEAKEKYPGILYNHFTSEYEIKSIQNKLNQIRKYIEDIETRFILDSIPFDADMVISKLREIIEPTTKKLKNISRVSDFIERYISDHEKTRAKGSLTVYKSLKNHISHFTSYTGNEITLDNVDISIFQSFQNFLIQCTALNNITIAKQLSTLKTILSYAKRGGFLVNQGYKDFRISKDSLEVIALNRDEFDLIREYDFKNDKRLEKVRDVFCFACATGLRYSDIMLLKRENIKNGVIKIVVKKTKEVLSIPLIKNSKFILEKYADNLNPLPIISNQKFNKYIKIACEQVGINEPVEIVRYKGATRIESTVPKFQLISSHVGRKTFVTLSLEKGMNAEVIKAITGHKDYKSFTRYIKVTETQTKLAMAKAWDSN